MDRRQREQARLACQISIGLMAGIFSTVPVVSASPVPDTSASAPKLGHFNVDQTTTAGVTAVTSTDKNNIVPWKDFSVPSGESVTFDGGTKGQNNYLNIVTGSNASAINGAIKGGNDVYLVNPHGVLIGEKANVDVGNLYVSTKDTASAVSEFTKNGSTGAKVIAGTANADVVNLGKLSAQNVEVVGKNITFTVTSDVAATAGKVNLTASDDVTNLGKITATNGDANISGANIYLMNDGNVISTTSKASNITADNIKLDAASGKIENFGTLTAGTNGNIDISGTDIKLMDTADVKAKAVNIAASGTAWIGTKTSTGKGTYTTPSNYTTSSSGTVKNFGTIKTADDLKYVANDVSATSDYEMANDVAWSGNSPIGNATKPFQGTFDGNYHAVTGINVTSGTYGGLFGYTNGATIKNVGVRNGSVSLGNKNTYVGGIAAYAVNSHFTNVFNDNVSMAGTKFEIGGIIGHSVNSTVDTAYNTGSIGAENRYGGGIIGDMTGGSIANVYTAPSSGSGFLVGETTSGNAGTLTNAYTTGSTSSTFGLPKETNVVYGVTSKNLADWQNKLTSISDSAVKADGTDDNTTWRIYEGQTMPLLRAFLRRGRGVVTVNYDYDQGTENGKAVTGTNGGADLDVYYNGNDLTLSNVTYAVAGGLYVDESKISPKTLPTFHDANVYTNDPDYNNDGKPIDANGNVVSEVKNAHTESSNGETVFYTGQDGYDLVGNRVYINQREVDVNNTLQNATIAKEYDGTATLSQSDIANLLAGASGSSKGFIAGDKTAKLDSSGLSARFIDANGKDDPNVGANKDVLLNGGVSLVNLNKHHNYKLTSTSTSFTNVKKQGDINPRKLVVDLTSSKASISKTYDGSASAGTPSTSDFAFQQVKATSTYDANNIVLSGGKAEDVKLGLKSGQSSYYGNYDATKNAFTQDADAGSKDVQYNGLFLDGTQAGNYVLVDTKGNVVYGKLKASATQITNPNGGTIYGKGTIDKRIIDTSAFTVKSGNSTAAPTKVYDGSSAYTLPSGSTLVQGTSSIADSGVVNGEKITFSIANGNAYFTDASGKATSQVANARNAAIGITATAGTGTNGKLTKLSNYAWGTPTTPGATTGTMGSALSVQPTTSITTKGSITPRGITVQVTQPSTVSIDKTYDGTTVVNYTNYPGANIFGTSGYVDYTSGSLKLADGTNGTTADGTSFKVTAAYDNKNVNRDAQNNVVARNIDYTVQIDGTNAANYTLNGTKLNSGTNSITILGSNSGAKGIINPKNLSSSFTKVTKTYDGTTNVPTGVIGTTALTTSNGLVSGDTVNLTVGNAAYQSKNVNGDGTTKVINNVTQKNWVNYSGLSLSGADAGNYTINATAEGEGVINPLQLTSGDFTYKIGSLTKEYDGDNTVSSSDALTGLTSVTVTSTGDVFKGTRTTTNSSGQPVSTSVNYTTNVSATYTSPDSNKQTAQDVNYTVTVVDDGSGNYVMPTGGITEKVTGTGAGVITPRKIEAHIVDSDLTKTYDADSTATANASKGNQYLISYTYAGTNPNVSKSAGLVGSDKDASTGVYVTKGTTTKDADASAVKGKDVLYTLKTNAKDQSNYEIVSVSNNGTTTTTTPITTLTGDGTINKRDLKVTFQNVTKSYDGTGAVTDAMITGALGLDDGTTGNAVITKDGLLKDFNTATTGSTQKPIQGAYQDSTNQFNAKNGYTVAYSNLLAALGKHAKNYNISNLSSSANGGTIYGTGDITKLALNGNFVFDFNTISKEYDGNANVAHTDVNGNNVTAESYINNAYVNNNGTQINLSKSKITATKATYNSPNSNNSQSQAVTYDLNFGSLSNYTVTNGSTWTNNGTTLTYNNGKFTATTTGKITPRKVIGTVNNTNVTKTYDATDTVQKGTSPLVSFKRYAASGTAVGTGLVSGDYDASTGAYRDANGVTANDADASVTQGKDVLYTFATSSSDPTNYEFVDANGKAQPTYLQKSGGTINKRNLTVTFKPVTKVYDGTTAVSNADIAAAVQLNDGTSNNAVITQDKLATDFNSGNSIKGTYVSPNVGTNIAVAYSNLQAALGTHAKNYTISNATNNTVNGTGTITALALGNNFKFDFGNITKEYDGSTNVANTDAAGTAHSAESYIADHYVDLNNNGIYDAGDILLQNITAKTATYASKDSGNSKSQAVTYDLNFGKLSNFSVTNGYSVTNGGTTLTYNNGKFTATTTGTITPRKVIGTVANNNITKTYDATTTVNKSTTPFINYTRYSSAGATKAAGLVSGDADASSAVYKDRGGIAAQDADASAKQGKDILYTLAINSSDPTNYEFVDANGKAQTTVTGQGTIDKAKLTMSFGDVSKVYDGKADVTTTSPAQYSGAGGQTTQTSITPTLSGFVGGQTAAVDAQAIADIQGSYVKWDPTKKTWVADEHVNWANINNQTLGYKAVSYSNLDNAFSGLASRNTVLRNYDLTGVTGATSLTTNANGIAQTVYFDEATKKGQIKPLALVMGDIQANTTTTTKEYDGTNAVKNPGLTLYETKTGNNVVIPYTLDASKTIYDNDAQGNPRVDQTNGQAVGVTYTLDSTNPFPAMTLNDFVINSATQQAYQGKTYAGDGIIDPKQIYVKLDKTQDITKAYDSTKKAATDNVKYYDSSNNQISPSSIIESRDQGKVSINATALFDDPNASIDRATSALQNARNITYTVDLDDTTRKGNYVLLGTNANTPAGTPQPVTVTDPTTGATTTFDRTENTYSATGDIYRAAIKVQSDGQSIYTNASPAAYTGKTSGWYNDQDAADWQAAGGDSQLTWNLLPGTNTRTAGKYDIYGWYRDPKTGNYPVTTTTTTDPTTGAVLTTIDKITRPDGSVLTRVTDATTGKVTLTGIDVNGNALSSSALTGWMASLDPAHLTSAGTMATDWASNGLAEYQIYNDVNWGTNYYFEQEPGQLTTSNPPHHGGGGGGGTVIPTPPVTPVSPVSPVTPVSPSNPVTPVTPSTPTMPSSTPDISSDVNAAKQFVPNANAYNNASHDDFGSVTRSGSAGLEYSSGGINVLSETGTPNVSTSEVDNAAIGLQNSGSIVNLSGGDAMEVDASRIDLTGGDSFTVTTDGKTAYDSTAAIETTGAQTKEGTAAIETAGAQTKDGAAAVDTTALDTTGAQTRDASATVETAGTGTTLTETSSDSQSVLSETALPSTDGSESRDAQAEVRSADADVTTSDAKTELQSTTDASWLFGDEASADQRQSETAKGSNSSSSEDSGTSLFANPQDDDAAAAQSAISVKTADDTESDDTEDKEDDDRKDADQADHADDGSIGIEAEGSTVNVAS